MKNRYCRRTKLSEEKFIFTMMCFFQGMTASRTHELAEEEGLPISRQTVERKFLEIGKYFYENTARPILLDPKFRRGTARAACDQAVEAMILNAFWDEIQGKTNYALYRARKTVYPEGLFIPHLKERWEALKGFPRETFVSHVGYAFFRFLAERTGKEFELFSGLLISMEQQPL